MMLNRRGVFERRFIIVAGVLFRVGLGFLFRLYSLLRAEDVLLR